MIENERRRGGGEMANKSDARADKVKLDSLHVHGRIPCLAIERLK